MRSSVKINFNAFPILLLLNWKKFNLGSCKYWSDIFEPIYKLDYTTIMVLAKEYGTTAYNVGSMACDSLDSLGYVIRTGNINLPNGGWGMLTTKGERVFESFESWADYIF